MKSSAKADRDDDGDDEDDDDAAVDDGADACLIKRLCGSKQYNKTTNIYFKDPNKSFMIRLLSVILKHQKLTQEQCPLRSNCLSSSV